MIDLWYNRQMQRKKNFILMEGVCGDIVGGKRGDIFIKKKSLELYTRPVGLCKHLYPLWKLL